MARGVFAIIDDINAGLAELKSALEPLSALVSMGRNGSTHQVGRPRKTRGRPARAVRTVKKARRKASPKLRAFRAMQGKYLGALRNLTATQRAQVKKTKASGGYEPALKLAAQLRK